jgi:IclR family pca regulon transcriptional regulator
MNHEVKSAARILELLEYLAGCSEPVQLKEIVAVLGFPKSSAHALAQTLVSRGYAIQDATERYVLVHGGSHGSAARAHEARLVSAAHPVMEALRDRSGETVVLSARMTRGDPKRLAKCVSRHAIRYDIDLDAPSSHSYCSATGRVLLAHWDPNSVEAYFARTPIVARTPSTVTDPDELRAILARVREQGYGISDEEYELGSTGLAAPVRDREGHVVAALNLGAVTTRFHARREEFIMMLKDAALQVSLRLGHKDGTRVLQRGEPPLPEATRVASSRTT